MLKAKAQPVVGSLQVLPPPVANATSTQSSNTPPPLSSKRKRTPGSHPKDTSSDSEADSNIDGDGSSSGESIHSNATAPAKRPQIYATQSSTQTNTPNAANTDVGMDPQVTPPIPIDAATVTSSPDCQDYGFHTRFFTFILSNSLHFR